MKKILSLALLGLFFVLPHTVFAAPTYTFAGTASGTITIASSSSASFHVVFPVVKNVSYSPDVCVTNDQNAPCDSTAVYDTGTATLSGKAKALPTVYTKPQVWDYTLNKLDPTKKYYLIVLGSGGYKNPEVHEFFTGTEKLSDKPVMSSNQDGNDVVVSTKIDITKYPYYQELSASLVYSTSNNLSNPIAGGGLTAKQGPDANSPTGINTISSPGAFFWRLTNLSPSTIYYYQVTITSKLGDSIKSDINSFNSSNGTTIAPGSAAQQADLNQRSYTLLSGFPGFSVLPDPDLCAQQRASGQHPQFCDINDVLNYAMKLLIGLAGVVLVARLMFEGYQYMMTDVPFLKASAKGGFFTALLGLLLALSAYLILNTINPKLVSESINIQQLAIGIDGDTNSPTIFVGTGQMPKGVYCPGSGRSGSVAQVAQSYKGKVTYSQSNKSATAGADGYAVLDCSSFVNTVLKCAGYTAGKDFVNEGTASIFANTEKVTMPSGFTTSGNDVLINNKKLNPGDVIGWPQTGTAGHALIYIGGGMFYDSHGGASGRQPGNAIGVYSASDIQRLYGGSTYGKIINSVERMPV